MFPIIAIFIEMYSHGKKLNFFSISGTIIDNPLLIMISTAPFFLGIFSLYAGVNHAKVINEKEKLTEIAYLLYEKSASLEKNNKYLKNEVAERVLNIKQMAYHDYLTGLPNRLSFYQNLNRIIDESDIKNDIFSVMFIDLDNFKHINDTLGHSFGDELLKAVSLRLSGILKKDSLLSRNGGDEFTVVINNVKNEKDMECVANRI
jgi:GGDEF domain-containing protein